MQGVFDDSSLSDGVLFVYITAADTAGAIRIAKALVSEQLAACVNILPGVRSVYRWRGAVEHADEVVLIAKTRAERFDALCARVRTLHTYETPCIVAWPIARGFPPFLQWVREASGPPGENRD